MALAEVTAILQDKYAWPIDCAPAPKAVAKEFEKPGTTDDAVASTLDAWCWSVAQTYHYGTIQPGTQDAYVEVRYLNFAIGCKYWELNTGIALGQQTETPVVQYAPARTTTEWAQNCKLGIDYLGYPNFDPNSDEAKKRAAKAANVPLEVSDAGLSGIWQMYAMYEYPFVVDEFRGLDTQKALDNLWARQQGQPVPWLPEAKNTASPQWQ